MRVAIDARRMQDVPPGGVGRMLRNLVPLLEPAVEVVLLTDARRPPVGGAWEEHPLRLPRGLPEPVWLQVSVARWLAGFDGVFHGPFNALPIRASVPSVVTFNDLAFEHHHEDFRPDKRLVWRAQARMAARAARAVVTISNFVRDGLVATYDLDPRRIFLSPPAVDPAFRPDRAQDAPRLLAGLGVERPYVIALGGARRRALDVAVGTWRRLRQSGGGWDLVVVGRQEPPAEPGIVHAGPVSDDQWASLLAGADAFCYPTRYEGYGMPALEAAAAGTPVVCAPIGPLPEVLGDAAAWCEEPSVEAMAPVLIALLGDEGRRTGLVHAGLARAAAAPTWAQSAAALVEAYQMADEP